MVAFSPGNTNFAVPSTQLKWTKPLPDHLLFDKAYTFEITFGSVLRQPPEISFLETAVTRFVRDPYMSAVGSSVYAQPGVLTFFIDRALPTLTQVDDTTAIELEDTTTVASFDIDMIHGRAERTIIFHSGVEETSLALNAYCRIRVQVKDVPVPVLTQFVDFIPPGMAWGDQPVAHTEIGLPLGTPTVQIVDSNGDVVTGSTATITLSPVLEDKVTAPDGSLNGTLAVSAVAGVATFPGLTFDGFGTILLRATSPDLTDVYSNPIEIEGFPVPAFVTGLRQNWAEDGTTAVKVTGVSSPSFAAPTANEKLILDGDSSTTDAVTIDGVRFRFLYPFLLKSIFMRGLLSTLASAPTIEIHTSVDTTTGQNGTFTLLTSFTPTRLNVFQSITLGDVSPTSTPIRGLWITLNDQGGAATMDWYSMHIGGMYLGALLQYGDPLQSGILQDEYILSIPNTGKPFSGTASADRLLTLNNVLTKDVTLDITEKPARFGGDTLADDEFSLVDIDDVALATTLVSSRFSQIPYKHAYSITAANNDGSGQHLSRVTVTRGGVPIWFALESAPTDTLYLYNSITGATDLAIALGSNPASVSFDTVNGEAYVLNSGTTKPFAVDVYSTRSGFLLRSLSLTDASINVALEPGDILILDNANIITTLIDSAAVVQPEIVVWTLAGVYVATHAYNGTVHPPGSHQLIAGAVGHFWAYESQGSSGSDYQRFNVTTGYLHTVPVDATQGGVGGAAWYDPIGNGGIPELVHARTGGASSYNIGRYREDTGASTLTPVTIPKPGLGDVPVDNVTGGWIDSNSGLEYVVWEGRAVWSCPRRTYGSLALSYDNGYLLTNSLSTVHTTSVLIKQPLPGYFAGAQLSTKPVVTDISTLNVAGLAYAIVLHEEEEPVPERFTTWGLAADAGVLYQQLGSPNQLIVGDAGQIFVLDDDISTDDGTRIPLNYTSGPVPQATDRVPVHTFRRFHEVSWETNTLPPAEGWAITLTLVDVDDPSNIFTLAFTQDTKEVRKRVSMRARQIRIDIALDTTTDFSLVGLNLKYQNTQRPLRGNT